MALEDICFSVVGGDNFSVVFYHFAEGGCVGCANDVFYKGLDLAVICCVYRLFNNSFSFLLFGFFDLSTHGLALL